MKLRKIVRYCFITGVLFVILSFVKFNQRLHVIKDENVSFIVAYVSWNASNVPTYDKALTKPLDNLCSRDTYLLIAVMSSAHHTGMRNAIRRSWNLSHVQIDPRIYTTSMEPYWNTSKGGCANAVQGSVISYVSSVGLKHL